MLTIKCTKSCPWGVHHAWGPVFQIEPDMVLNTEDCPTNTNPADWKAFFQKLLEEGHAVVIPNEEPVKDQDTGDDNSEGHDNESPENTGTSDDQGGDTGSDTPDDNQDTENTDESIDKATDEAAMEAFNTHTNASDAPPDASSCPEATPGTLKAELEEIALKEMDGPMGSEQKAKAVLENVSKERYGFDVDKRHTTEKIIENIVEAAFKQAE